jgi:DNA helicase-2/ATP-dependent DNA helicase PcrA
MEWSHYQRAVFTNVVDGEGNTVVFARAGSGKTTVIIESLRLMHPAEQKKTMLCAFNKDIAKVLARRAPGAVSTTTIHSYGYRLITKSLGFKEVDEHYMDYGVRELYPKLKYEAVSEVTNAARLAKVTLSHTEEEVRSIIDEHGIDANVLSDSKDADERIGVFVRTVLQLLHACRDVDECIDYADMVWLPNVLDLPGPKFSRVIIDETQDFSRAQIELALRACQNRLIAVGDDRQSIYGFNGADSNAIPSIQERLHANVLKLPVTYRCAEAIVEEAKLYVPDLELAPHAKKGKVVRVGNDTRERDYVLSCAMPGDFVLSRLNAPLVGMCFAFIRRGIPVHIQGRDIGKQLANFIRRGRCYTVEDVRMYVREWTAREKVRLKRKKPVSERALQLVNDRRETILELCDGAESVGEIYDRIAKLFEDKTDKDRVVLSSTHRAKGQERKSVFVLADTFMFRPGIEEENLYYVAVTRAQEELYLTRTDAMRWD